MQDLLSIGTNRRESMIGAGIGLGLAGYRLRTSFEAMPSLDLQFADRRMIQAVLGPTPSFSRASTGTYFDSQGVLQSAAVNGPRFNHVYNGTSWVSKGLLVEEQRTNVAIYSNTFSNAAWEKYDSSISSSGTGPDGSTASLLTENTANGAHWLRQQTSTSVASGAGVSVTASIFVKANGRSVVGFGFDNSFAFVGKSVRGRFDLSDGSFANEYNCDSYSITNVGNGWYRLSVTSTAIQAGVARFDFFLYNSDTSGGITYTGDGSSGVVLFGAQVEQGAFPTSYIGTTSASTTRSADVCQITGSDFSGFWNGTEGSIAAEYDLYSPSVGSAQGESFLWQVDDGTNNNRILVTGTSGSTASNKNRYAVITTAGTQALLDNQVVSANVSVYSSATWKLNDAAFYSGSNGLFDTSVAIPAGQSSLRIGQRTGDYYLNGHIARLRYYPTRLTNTKLQELST